MKQLKIGIFLACSVLAASAGVAVAAGLARGGHAASPARMAFSRGNSLWVASTDGGNRHLVATGPNSWYAWSPDGRYLLVSKSFPRLASSELILYDANGTRLRVLVRRAPWGAFYPSWASNVDQVAFVAGTCAQTGAAGCAHPSDEAVYGIDVQGHRAFLGSYPPNGASCGGGLEDPAADLYRIETDFGVTMPVLHWTAGRPVSFLGVMGYIPPQLQGTSSAQVPSDIAVSSQGLVAGTIQRCSSSGCVSWVALVDRQSGRVLRVIAPGELPAWSPDGRTLYFVRRTSQRTFLFHDSNNNAIPSQVYRSEIWRITVARDPRATGGESLRGMRMIVSQMAYGFGPLTIAPDGRTIIVSRTGNATRLWQHRLPGDRFDDSLLKSYGPRVSIERIDVTTGTVTPLVANAGRPAVQPALS